ncbi:hypothetical protein P5673_015711 [Acropora cervicornis]|uniref:Uncharacterized protein n=1 Tax=Acropora cervicornis TaxID=6130 RepID=A0AAD9QH69_ACRCE|nr:hypothetical protein P5673_015711 [Acropora cervicornis]
MLKPTLLGYKFNSHKSSNPLKLISSLGPNTRESLVEKEWDYFVWYMTSRKSPSSFTREGSHQHHSVDFRMELILEEELDNCSSRFLSET